jgi:hypothetical protein
MAYTGCMWHVAAWLIQAACATCRLYMQPHGMHPHGLYRLHVACGCMWHMQPTCLRGCLRGGPPLRQPLRHVAHAAYLSERLSERWPSATCRYTSQTGSLYVQLCCIVHLWWRLCVHTAMYVHTALYSAVAALLQLCCSSSVAAMHQLCCIHHMWLRLYTHTFRRTPVAALLQLLQLLQLWRQLLQLV